MAASPWRVYAALASASLVAQVALLLASGPPRLAANEIASGDTLLFMLAGIAGLVAAFPHARQGPRAALALLAALALGAALGVATRLEQGLADPWSSGQAVWKAIAFWAVTLPPALVWARGARRGAAIAGAGAAAATIGIALAASRAVAFDDARALPALALVTLGALLVAFALAREAWRPHPAPARPLSPWILPGPVTLALAWALGGDLLVIVPLWILAPVLLAGGALARPRARPTAALAALALLAAGALLPLGTCTFPNISDAIRPNEPRSFEERVTLWEVAGHGPRWIHSDLMGGGPVECAPTKMIPGAAWLLALVFVGWVPWPEPRALRERIARVER